MRKLISCFVLTICFSSIFAQDLVVTDEGDSLNCKITSVKNGNVYFTFKHKEETRSTLLPINQIKTYQYSFYKTAIVSPTNIIFHETFPHWRLAFEGGYSYQMASVGNNVPPGFISYVDALKSGYHIGASVTYYFSELIGVGFKYLLFKTSNEMDNIYVTQPDGSTEFGNLSDDISITFLGPTVSTRFLNSKKNNAFYLILGIGYLGLQDNMVIVNTYTQTGNTVGIIWEVGYDIGLTKNLAIGFNLTLLGGSLNQYNLNDGLTTTTIHLPSNNYIDFSRIDLSIGIRFNSNK